MTQNTKPDASTDTATDTGPETGAPAPTNRKFETVPLIEPIARGDTTIDSLTIRKPKAGELRGLSLGDIINAEVGALLKLIPRISDPILTDEETADLDPADFTEIGGAIRGFFMTSGERRMMDAMIAEQQPKT